MNSPSTYVFGKTSTNDVELGETYHVALALALDYKAKVFVEDFPKGEDFLTLLNFQDRISYSRPLAPTPLPAIAETFKTHETRVKNAGSYLWKIIEKRAKTEKWENKLLALNIWLPDPKGKSTLLWLRNSNYKPERNLTKEGLRQVVETCQQSNCTPIIVGPLPDSWSLEFYGVQQLGPFYDHSFFQTDSIARQLWFLNYLHEKGNIVANIGMMSGAMDGLAFFARKRVIFFESGKNKTRMAKVSKLFESFERIKVENSITPATPFQSFSVQDLITLKAKLLLPDLA